MTEVAPAQDALVKVDGISRTSSSNTLTDLVDGITLTNGRRMTIPASLAPAHLAALLGVLDPR